MLRDVEYNGWQATEPTSSWPQDGCGSEEQAEQFSENWQGIIDGVTEHAETTGR